MDKQGLPRGCITPSIIQDVGRPYGRGGLLKPVKTAR